jgi:dolichol-phosphate mannosyltransferase
MKILTAIPIYNEAKYLEQVLSEVRRQCTEILVINDGSTDATPQLIARQADLHIITHKRNLGYGAALRSAMHFALAHHYEVLVTMDCDGQHEPARIPVLLEALSDDVDLVSGSRYLRTFHQDTPPPADRRRINHLITQEINERFGLNLTDTFCGFKAYRVPLLSQLHITESSWGMPLQLWVQAAARGWRIREVAVPLLYLDPNRAFGGVLNDAEQRLAYYRQIIDAEATRQMALTLGSCS